MLSPFLKGSSTRAARFARTIAHELAHVVVDRTGSNAPRAGKELERLSDIIAVELLMPAHIFRAQLPAVLHIPDIFSLAKRFQASLAATAHRCAELSRSTLFEVAHEKVTWSCGPLRRSSALRDDGLIKHIRSASAGESRHTVLYLNHELIDKACADRVPLVRQNRPGSFSAHQHEQVRG